MIVRNWFSAVALGGILFIAGCGGAKLPADLPKLYPAQIEVTATDGAKIEGAVVTLSLIGGAGEPVGGSTDAKGIAKLYTRGQYAGAPAGKYKVCVNWAIILEGPTSQKPVPTDPKELDIYKRKVASERKAKPALEAVYRDTKNTPLEVEIGEGKNSFPVEVKKLDKQPTWQ